MRLFGPDSLQEAEMMKDTSHNHQPQVLRQGSFSFEEYLAQKYLLPGLARELVSCLTRDLILTQREA